MSIKKTYRFLLLTIIVVAIYSCVEPFDDFNTEIFESALVIEATITNELKPQEILLSRTFALEEDGPSPESNAIVKIIDDTQQEYLFQEMDAGKYVSTNAFKAESNTNYKLSIQTSDGKSYASETTVLSNTSHIDAVYAKREFNKDTIEGISIFVDSFDPSRSSNYYRYTFEETYKIIAPNYSSLKLVFDEGSFTDYNLIQRPKQKKVCYKTVSSKAIIITNTNDLMEDRIDRFSVRFIKRDNFIISHRYSVLVKQFVQSREAFTYYETLKNLSEFESIFSENQSGFISGNVFSESYRNEKVIGFFQVSSVDSQRIFFDYTDLFPNEDLPPYAISCSGLIAPEVKNGCIPLPDGGEICNYPLFDNIQLGFQYVTSNSDGMFGSGPFILSHRECGDCTALGKNEIPNFWIE